MHCATLRITIYIYTEFNKPVLLEVLEIFIRNNTDNVIHTQS